MLHAPCESSRFGENSLRRRVSRGFSGCRSDEHIFFVSPTDTPKARPVTAA